MADAFTATTNFGAGKYQKEEDVDTTKQEPGRSESGTPDSGEDAASSPA